MIVMPMTKSFRLVSLDAEISGFQKSLEGTVQYLPELF